MQRTNPDQTLEKSITSAAIREIETQKATTSWAWLFLIIFGIGAFYLSTIRDGHKWGDDFGIYISHARNIIEGRPYRDTGYIYNPHKVLGPQTYPPVFPLLLAPVYKAWGLNLTAMKVEVILIFLLSLLAIYLAFIGELQWPYSLVLVALVGLNPQFWIFKENIVSDLPFLFFTYLSFYLIHKAYRTDQTTKSQTLYIILISISMLLTYGTRSIGLVFIPCLFFYHVIKRKRAAAFGISITLLSAAFIYTQTRSSHSLIDYAGHFGFARFDLAMAHLQILFSYLSHFWTHGSEKLIPQLLFAMLTGLAVVGYLARIVKKQVSCFELFVPLYLAPLIILPVVLELRFIFPIIPLYLFYVFLGIQSVSTLGSEYRRQVEMLAFAGMVVAILISYARQYTTLDYGPIPSGIHTVEAQQVFEYVKKEVGQNEVIIFNRPRALSLLTGRASATWHNTQDDQQLLDFFRQINASCLIVGPGYLEPAYPTYIQDFVDRNHAHFQETFMNADFRVYRILQ